MTSHRASVVIGVDLGTSSVKTLAMDDSGRVLAMETASYPTLRPRADWAEQRPDDWWAAAVAAVRRLSAHPAVASATVQALGLSGQMHGLVLAGTNGSPLRDALIWADARGQRELADLAAHLPDQRFARITGSGPYASATLAKLLWLRAHEPETLSRTAHVLLAKDELRRRLTGVIATDPSDASGTQLYDVAACTWSREVLETARLDPSLLPAVVPSDAVAGRLSGDAAAATGLPGGLPVATGGGDAACAALGAGIAASAAGPRTGLLSLGTAGQLAVLSSELASDPSARAQTLCAVTAGEWLTMGAILSGGFAMQWLATITGAPDAAVLLEEAATVPAGSTGLLFLPYLAGARTPHMDPTACGVFVGLRAAHERRHLARAVVEGVAFALRECLDVLRELGLGPDALMCIGRPAREPLWQTTLANVLRVPLDVTPHEHASVRGAALLGWRALGVRVAGDESEDRSRVLPDARATDGYEVLFATFQGLYPTLRATMSQLVRELSIAEPDSWPGE